MADSARTAAEIGVLLHSRLLAGGRDRARWQELAEQLLSQDAATRSVARDEVVDRGLLDQDGPVAILLIRHFATDDSPPHESLGSVESLIEHPARMTHCTSAGTPVGVSDSLLRLSIGLEDCDELIADLDQALTCA